MPLSLPERTPASARRAGGTHLPALAAVTLVAFGAFAFGAVYPWAYIPLALAAGAVGAAAWARESALPRDVRRIGIALGAVALAAALQLVPLPTSARQAVSPRTDALLSEIDLTFALEATGAGSPAPGRAHPLSIDPEAGVRGLILLTGLALLLLGTTAALGTSGVGRLTTWLIAVGFAVAAVGIGQKAALGDEAYTGMKIYGFWAPEYKLTTPFGPFVNKNHYAGWMVMTVPLAVGYVLGLWQVAARRLRPGWRNRLLWLSSPEGGRAQLALVAVAAMAVSLMMTASRSGVACFVVAIAIAAAIAVRHQSTRTARLAVLLVLGVIAIAPVLWASTSLAKRFDQGLSDPSIRLRLDAWAQAMAVIREVPITGTGLNTFGVAALRYQRPGQDHYFREAHNDYLQLAAEGGILVTLPAAVALIAAAVAIRRRFAAEDPESLTYWIRFGATTGLLAIALQSTVEFSLQMPGNAVLMVVLLAIALHAPGRRVQEARASVAA